MSRDNSGFLSTWESLVASHAASNPQPQCRTGQEGHGVPRDNLVPPTRLQPAAPDVSSLIPVPSGSRNVDRGLEIPVPYTQEISQGPLIKNAPTTQTSWLGRIISRNTGGELPPFMITSRSLSCEGGHTRRSIHNNTPGSVPSDEARGRPIDRPLPSVNRVHPPSLSRHPSTDSHSYPPPTTSRHPSLDRNFHTPRGSISSQSSYRSHSIGPNTDIDRDSHSSIMAGTSFPHRDRAGTPQTVISRHPSVNHELSVPVVSGVEQRRTAAPRPIEGSANTRPIGTVLS